jgi:hypothetical protein
MTTVLIKDRADRRPRAVETGRGLSTKVVHIFRTRAQVANLSSRKRPMSWRVAPSVARSAMISPTTLQNL